MGIWLFPEEVGVSDFYSQLVFKSGDVVQWVLLVEIEGRAISKD